MSGVTSHPSADAAAVSGRRGPRRVRGGAVVVLVVALLVAMAGCGDDDTSSTTGSGDDGAAEETTAADPPATRTVDTENGPVEIPADPQRIIALDEYAAMNMLALGIEPAIVWGTFNAQVPQQVLAAADIEVVEASVEAGINVEAVGAEQPDLIVFTAEPAFLDSYDMLSEFAPTVVLPYDQPWRDAIETTATTFDREAEGDHLIGVLEARIDGLAAEVQADPVSISLLGNILDMLFAVSHEAPLSALITEVGLTRPVAQAEGMPFEGYRSVITMSSEVLDEHDADLVVVFSGTDCNAGAVTSLPTFQSLPAVVDGRSFEVDGGMWFGTFPFAVHWVLDDLAALTGGEGQAALGTVDDTDARWTSFQGLGE